MKYLSLTAAPDLDLAPQAFRTIAASPDVAESRLLDWNVTNEGVVVFLFRVEGHQSRVAEALTEAPEVIAVDCTTIDDERFHALVRLDADEAPLLQTVLETAVRRGILIVTPVVYRDGTVEGTLVGESDTLQAVVDSFPRAINLTIHEVGTYRSGLERVASELSERQREALLAGLDLGYYEVPREATHEAVAERLACAPSTAAEHLQKAEAKLVRAAIGEKRPVSPRCS